MYLDAFNDNSFATNCWLIAADRSHEADQLALSNAYAWGAGHDAPAVPVKDVRTIVDGSVLEFAGFRIEVRHTPGHTPGSVCYLTDGFVLSGDLVFAGSIGRH